MILISHDEKADRKQETDTPEKWLKKGVFGFSIDQSENGYHKKSEVSPGNRKKRQDTTALRFVEFNVLPAVRRQKHVPPQRLCRQGGTVE